MPDLKPRLTVDVILHKDKLRQQPLRRTMSKTYGRSNASLLSKLAGNNQKNEVIGQKQTPPVQKKETPNIS